MSLSVLASITADMAREMAVSNGVCIRPILRRVLDRDTGTQARVPIACGSTREAVCPPCARKAMALRMQQCAEGWHRDTEPDQPEHDDRPNEDQINRDDQDDDGGSRRVRSTRRRQDTPDLPRVPMEARTVGRTFSGNDGRQYRPSMFLTLTLPSYGQVRNGVPVDPDSYDYRRASLDALHFAKLVDRFWQNLRRAAGFRVQYFAAIEPQQRLTPHLHAAMRGVVSREVLRQVIKATYVQVWWPPHDQPIYIHGNRSGPATGTATPTPAPCCPPGNRPSTRWQRTRTLGRRM